MRCHYWPITDADSRAADAAAELATLRQAEIDAPPITPRRASYADAADAIVPPRLRRHITPASRAAYAIDTPQFQLHYRYQIDYAD
jgi:hypothetical protein